MRINGAKVTGQRSDGILPDLTLNGGASEENWEVIKKIRANAKVPGAAGTWEEIDDEVIRAYEQEAKLIADIRDMGLTTDHDIGNLFSSYRVSSLMNDAEVDMSGETMGDEDRIDYSTNTVPVPVIHKEFRIGWRESANANTSQDNIAEATRSVSRVLEDIAWGGRDFTVEGNKIQGLDDVAPSPGWGTYGNWNTGDNAIQEILTGMGNLEDKGFGPPYNLYVPNAQRGRLGVMKSNTTETYEEIIEGLDGMNAVRYTNDIVDTSSDSSTVFLVSMTRRSLDLAISQWITPINWETGPNGRVTQYQVFAVAIPRIKKDYAGDYGVEAHDDITS